MSARTRGPLRINAAEWVPDDVKRMATDYHGLRTEYIALLEASPEAFFSAASYETMLRRLRPTPVVASPRGELGVPPDGFRQVLGYEEPGSSSPEAQWWWAAAPREWPKHNGEAIALSDHEAWVEAISLYGPVAKLLMNGRRHRATLDLEAVHAEKRLTKLGWEIRISPLFASPQEEFFRDAGFVFDLTGEDRLPCDFCSGHVMRDTASVVSPWYFRQSRANAQLAVRAWGGGNEGWLRYLRDWSVWLVCPVCRRRLFED